MLGHLVPNTRLTPPDFGIAAWLRGISNGLSLPRVLAHLFEARKPSALPQ